MLRLFLMLVILMCLFVHVIYNVWVTLGRVETESGGTRRRTGGEVKGKEANGVGSQQSSAWLALQESQYSTELTPPPI